MAYTPTVYVDGIAPPLSAANLNKSETAIANNDTRVTTLEAQRLTAVGDGTTDDTASINAQLAAAPAGSVLRGVPGKTYLISAPLMLRGGGQQTLDMTGCTVTLKAASNCNMLNNAAVVAQRSTTDGAMTSGTTTLTSATAAFTSADVGRSVNVAAASLGGFVLTATITAVTNGTTVTLSTAAGATVSAAAVTVYNRDTNIVVQGGTWARQNNGGTGNANHSLLFRHADGVTVRDLTVTSTAGKYAVSVADVTRYRVERLHFDVFSDGVHVMGPATSGVIRGLTGYAGDDLVAFTPNDWAPYNDVIGFVTDTVVEDLYPANVFTAAVMINGGSAATGIRNLRVRNVFGTVQANARAAIFIQDDAAQPNTTGGLFDEITVENVSTTVPNGRPLIAVNAANVRRARFRGLYFDNAAATTSPILISPPAGSTLGHLTFEDVAIQNLPGTQGIINLAANTTVTSLTVDGLQSSSATGWYGLSVFGTVLRLLISGAQATGASARLVQVFGTGTVQRLAIADCLLDSVQSVNVSSGGTLTSVEVTGVVSTATAYPLGVYNGSTTALKAANVTATGMTAWLWVQAGAVTILGASGLSGDVDTYTGNVLLAARGSSALSADPTLLSAGEETVHRLGAQTNSTAASGQLILTYFTARRSETINNITTITGNTPATAGATLCRLGLYTVAANGDLTLVASMANDTTMWSATFTTYTKALSAPFAKVAGQRYALGALFVGTTAPRWLCGLPLRHNIAPRLNGTVAAQTDLPASVTAGTVAATTGISLYAELTP